MTLRIHLSVDDPGARARLLALIRTDPGLVLVGRMEEADVVIGGAENLNVAGQGSVLDESAELTSRELEVLRLMGEGHGNRIIARELGISTHTVKFHVASVLAKLGAHTRTEAVARGMRQGLVPL